MAGNIETGCYYSEATVTAKMNGTSSRIRLNEQFSDSTSSGLDSAIVLLGIVLAVAPIFWIARQILSPIDRAAKFRKAAVRFSIGDFLCLFLAIQIPLAAVHGFLGEDTMEAYWTFTLITWLVAPVIWYAGGRTLSKAQVTSELASLCILGTDHAARVLWLGSIHGTRVSLFSSSAWPYAHAISMACYWRGSFWRLFSLSADVLCSGCCSK